MKKDDYKAEFEEHRKEISLGEGQGAGDLPSRSELHRKGRKPKKKSGHTMINIVLGLFTLIPVLILVYVVSDFYSPEDSTEAKVGEQDPTVLYETGDKLAGGNSGETNKDIVVDEKADDKGKVDKADDKNAGKEEVVTPPAPKNEAETKVEPKPEKKPVVDVNPAPEKKPEKAPVPEKKPTGKSHTVANGETLYRISVNYYGSDVGVEKIKQANGLSSNNIVVGQTLVIP